MPVKGQARGADNLVIAAHIKKDMLMIERRQRSNARETLSVDLDDRNVQIIMEVGNRCFCHDTISSRELTFAFGRIQAGP